MSTAGRINKIKSSIPGKYFIIFLAVVLIGCLFIGFTIRQKGEASVVKPQTYHEIETDFDMEKDYNRPTEEAMEEEIASLKAKGNDFWYNQSQKAVIKESMQDVYGRIKCQEEKCFIVGMDIKDRIDYLRPLLPEWKIGDCQVIGYGDWCAIVEPKLSEDIIKILGQSWLLPDFYIFGKDVYAVGSANGDNNYSVFKNNKEMFSRDMGYGAENVIIEASIVLNSPAFTFYEPIDLHNGNTNIWYNAETLNEKYGIESSSFLFSYKDKTGFVGEKDGKKFFFFNGQKVSGDFDEIRTHGCCAIQVYPIELDQNGILFFLGKRGGEYFFTEVNLNKYL
jgi:hypothetical protein